MAILFNHAITRVGVFPKYAPTSSFESSLSVVRNFKRKIGRKFLFFPVYEIIPAAVVKWRRYFRDHDEFVCELKDFKHKHYYFENDVLYEKPHCVIYMNDKSSREVHFETVEELNAYVDVLKEKAPHIEV